jgi:hypothetical protein
MLARVRWSNVAAALAALLLFVLVVAWPLMGPAAPRLPEGPPRVVVATPTPAGFERQAVAPRHGDGTRAGGGGAERRRRSPNDKAAGRGGGGFERQRPKRGRPKIPREDRGRRSPKRSAPPSVPAVPAPVRTPVPPAPPASAAPPASREFGGFELN